MKKLFIAILLANQVLLALDFTFSTDLSHSTIGKQKIGFSMGLSDYQTRYKSGFTNGWGVGITTIGSGEPDKYYSEGVIISTPSDIKDTMLWVEYRPMWRWHERNELYLMLGGMWNHITSHSYGYGPAYGIGYQRIYGDNVLVGSNMRITNLLFNSGEKETTKYDNKYYQVYILQVYMGFRF